MLVAAAPAASGQGVVVAPHVVVIDHRTRSTSITLYNPGSEPAEVTISSFFGYPVTDTAGNFELATPADPGSLPSAADWVQAYPRRMTIGPLERQTVRLLARAPANLPDGEYWSRLMIAAKGGRVPVALADSAPAGIQIGLDLEVRTIIPLQYRKGAVSTGITIDSVRVEQRGDSLVARARLVRHGNAAFVGTAVGRLVDERNTVVADFSAPIAIYGTIDPRFVLTTVPRHGRFRFELELRAERQDLPRDQLVKALPATAGISVILP